MAYRPQAGYLSPPLQYSGPRRVRPPRPRSRPSRGHATPRAAAYGRGAFYLPRAGAKTGPCAGVNAVYGPCPDPPEAAAPARSDVSAGSRARGVAFPGSLGRRPTAPATVLRSSCWPTRESGSEFSAESLCGAGVNGVYPRSGSGPGGDSCLGVDCFDHCRGRAPGSAQLRGEARRRPWPPARINGVYAGGRTRAIRPGEPTATVPLGAGLAPRRGGRGALAADTTRCGAVPTGSWPVSLRGAPVRSAPSGPGQTPPRSRPAVAPARHQGGRNNMGPFLSPRGTAARPRADVNAVYRPCPGSAQRCSVRPHASPPSGRRAHGQRTPIQPPRMVAGIVDSAARVKLARSAAASHPASRLQTWPGRSPCFGREQGPSRHAWCVNAVYPEPAVTVPRSPGHGGRSRAGSRSGSASCRGSGCTPTRAMFRPKGAVGVSLPDGGSGSLQVAASATGPERVNAVYPACRRQRRTTPQRPPSPAGPAPQAWPQRRDGVNDRLARWRIAICAAPRQAAA